MQDIINIVLVVIEWRALYLYQKLTFNVLRYLTPVGYALVLSATIVQLSTNESKAIEAEEIVDIVASALILLLGVLKGYKSYLYFKVSIEALDNPMSRSVISETDYE